MLVIAKLQAIRHEHTTGDLFLALVILILEDEDQLAQKYCIKI